ncbi:MAG: ATP-dependent Clp protease adapter ClpS [Bdellovibrionaceae bacterium]|nr:ATP-dependent Clp protease adapter ClpS [Pseudobdellovibrionaceae bacterium]
MLIRPLAQSSEQNGEDLVIDAPARASGIAPEEKQQTRTPSLYRVLLVNDDFTPMDFVILILQRFFQKPADEATKIMLEVHQKGAGICGIFSHEVAETKVHIVNTFAKSHRFPLKCTMEKAE